MHNPLLWFGLHRDSNYAFPDRVRLHVSFQVSMDSIMSNRRSVLRTFGQDRLLTVLPIMRVMDDTVNVIIRRGTCIARTLQNTD